MESIVELLTSLTGVSFDVEDLNHVADRTNTIERAFNAREGLTRHDDILPKQLLEEPLPEGLAKGQVLRLEELESMKNEYYEIMGWDVATGIPTKQCLESLGLYDVAQRFLNVKK